MGLARCIFASSVQNLTKAAFSAIPNCTVKVSNDTSKTPPPFSDRLIRPHPKGTRIRRHIVKYVIRSEPVALQAKKKRLRSEMVVPKLKNTTLDSREIVCVRERKTKPAFSSSEIISRSVAR